MIETLTLADLSQPGKLITLPPEQPIGAAITAMAEQRVSSVVLVEEDQPVGIFTERDALALIARGQYAPTTPLSERMSRDPVMAEPHLSFADGYARMVMRGCRHLILVDARGRVSGVLSETDFAHALGAEELLSPRLVKDLMTRDPVTLPPEASLATALALMDERRISSVVMVEHGRAVGILSERDAIRFARMELSLQATPIAEQMSRPVHGIAPDRPAHEASPRMRALGVRRLVVTDERGQLLGILTRHDLLKDVQDIYVRLLRRVVAVQGEVLQDARKALGEHHVLRSLLQHAEHLGIVVADTAQVIRFINDAALRSLGLTADLARTRSYTQLLATAGLTPAVEAQRLGFFAGTERLVLDLPRDLGVERRWLRFIASGVQDEVGNRAGYLLTIQDRTEEHAAQQQQRLIKTLFENTSEGIMITDADNRIVAVNPGFTLITGYSAAEVIGRNPRLLSSGRHDAPFYRALWEQLLRTGAWRGEVWNRRKNGEIYPERLQINQVRGPDGEVIQHVAILSDLSAAQRSAAEIDYLSYHDPLTGLPNLARLRVQLTESLERAATARRRIALLILDLDSFSDLVASHGHLAGDDALKTIGARLIAESPPTDILARLASDRFVIARPLEPELDAAVQATQIAQALRQVVRRPLELPGLPDLTVTATLGIAVYPEDGANVTTLLRNAESALSQAKLAGRSSTAFYRPELTQAARRRIQMESELRRAIECDELRLLYQPIVSVTSKTIVAAEALLRWQHPNDGLVTPRDFIEAVEHSELVHPVGRWVLEQAAAQARDWLSHGRVRISINISAPQIAAGNLARQIEEVLDQTGLDPRLLGVEVLERILLRDPDQALAELGRIRDLGVSIALDDFGSGYSSLGYLKRLPVDYLKIDRGFIRHLTSDPIDEAIVRSTIAMAHNLGLQVIAEGVETADQLAHLASAGCDLVQGYLLGRPMMPGQIGTMLKAAHAG